MPEDNRNRNVNRIKKILIVLFVGLLLFSFILNIVLLVRVWQLDRKVTQLYSSVPVNCWEINI